MGQTPSTPLTLLLGGPSCLSILISTACLLCPEDPHGLNGALEGNTYLGAQQAARPKWVRQSHSAPLPLFPESHSHLPLLSSLASGALILSDLHFSSPLSTPVSYWFTCGSSRLLGHQCPPPMASSCPSCGEVLTRASSRTAILTPPPTFTYNMCMIM